MDEDFVFSPEDYESINSNNLQIESSNLNQYKKEKDSEKQIEEYKFDDVSLADGENTPPPKIKSPNKNSNLKSNIILKNQTKDSKSYEEVQADNSINKEEIFKSIDRKDFNIQTKPNKEKHDNDVYSNKSRASKDEDNSNDKQLNGKSPNDDKQKEHNDILSKLYLTQNNSNQTNKNKLDVEASQPMVKPIYTECNDKRYNKEDNELKIIDPTNHLSDIKNQYNQRLTNSKSYAKSKEEYRQYAKLSYELKRKANTNRPFSIDKQAISFQVPLSKFEQAEIKYGKLKAEIEKMINIFYTNVNDISNQNTQMIQYLSLLNSIVGTLTENVRLSYSKQNINHSTISKHKDYSSMDRMLLERYKKEYLQAQARLSQLSDPTYENMINRDLGDIKTKIAYYENENKRLKNAQKVSGVILEKQTKTLPKLDTEIKRIEMDYNALKNQYNSLLLKVDNDKKTIKENEAKINELNTWSIKLKQNAKEEYNITQFENIEAKEMKRKKNEKEIEMLLKKYKILKTAIEANSKKYYLEIKAKERKIIEKKERKEYLLKSLADKTHQIEHFNQMVTALYSLPKKKNSIGQELSTDDVELKNGVIEDKDNTKCLLNDDYFQKDTNNDNLHSKTEDNINIISTHKPFIVTNVESINIRNEENHHSNLYSNYSIANTNNDKLNTQRNTIENKKFIVQSHNALVLPLIENPYEKKNMEMPDLSTYNCKNNSQTNGAMNHGPRIAQNKEDDVNLAIDQFNITDYIKDNHHQSNNSLKVNKQQKICLTVGKENEDLDRLLIFDQKSLNNTIEECEDKDKIVKGDDIRHKKNNERVDTNDNNKEQNEENEIKISNEKKFIKQDYKGISDVNEINDYMNI